MLDSGRNDRTKAWDRYWKADRIAACGGGRYSEVFERNWRALFKQQPDCSCIVDLCTGNGAVALIAAETAKELQCDFQIHGVDRAKIDPRKFVESAPSEIELIDFHSNTPCENLPFEDNSVDLAVSQFGIEYTDLHATTEEVGRVIRPGGALVSVCHAREGSVVSSASEQLRQMRLIDEKAGLFDLARSMLELALELERGPQPPKPKKEAKYFKTRKRYQNSKASLYEALANTPTLSILNNIVSVFEHAFQNRVYHRKSELLAKLAELREEFETHRTRLMHLCDVALDSNELEELRNMLVTSSFGEVRVSQVEDPAKGLVAYCVEAIVD